MISRWRKRRAASKRIVLRCEWWWSHSCKGWAIDREAELRREMLRTAIINGEI